jgi:thioredoxin reductase (NADPH)
MEMTKANNHAYTHPPSSLPLLPSISLQLTNINLICCSIVTTDNVDFLTIENVKTKAESQLKVQGLFVAIGHQPNSQLFRDQGLKFDETGYILRKGENTETHIPGVFVAGDVSDHVYRQAITAAGMGCQAAIDAQNFLENEE